MNPDHESSAPDSSQPDEATSAQARLDESRASSSVDGMIDQARALFDAALDAFQSSLTLLRAELRLAKSSAAQLLMLAAVLAVLAIGAWLGLLALVAAGVHELVDNWFIGVGSVVILNALGIVWVVIAMRRRLRDITMPRTRRMLSGLSHTATPSEATTTEARP